MSEQKMREALEALRDAYAAEGGPGPGHIYKGPTREWQAGVHRAWQLAHEALAHQPVAGVELTDAELREVLRTCPPDVVSVVRHEWLRSKFFVRRVIAAHEAKKAGGGK